MGEHRHPHLVEQFTVLEGALTVKRDGQTSILHQGQTAVIQPGVWHDWWNAGDCGARVRVEVTPGERFVHMVETFFGAPTNAVNSAVARLTGLSQVRSRIVARSLVTGFSQTSPTSIGVRSGGASGSGWVMRRTLVSMMWKIPPPL